MNSWARLFLASLSLGPLFLCTHLCWEARQEQVNAAWLTSKGGEFLFTEEFGVDSNQWGKDRHFTFIDFLLREIAVISLAGTDISTTELDRIRRCWPELKVLRLGNTNVGDDAVNVLIQLRMLQRLGVEDTGLTIDGIRTLQKGLPNTLIDFTHNIP